MELLYNTSDLHRVITQAVQQMWKEHLGVQVDLVTWSGRCTSPDKAVSTIRSPAPAGSATTSIRTRSWRCGGPAGKQPDRLVEQALR